MSNQKRLWEINADGRIEALQSFTPLKNSDVVIKAGSVGGYVVAPSASLPYEKEPFWIEDKATLRIASDRADIKIGKGVLIKTGSVVSNSTLGSDVLIMDGCTITESALGPGCIVRERAQIDQSTAGELGMICEDASLAYCSAGDSVLISRCVAMRGKSSKQPILVESRALINEGTQIQGDVHIGGMTQIGVASKITATSSGAADARTLIGRNVRIGDRTKIGADVTMGVTIGEDVQIGNDCTVMPGVTIEPSTTIGAFCWLGDRSIVKTRSEVDPGVKVLSRAIVNEGCQLRNSAIISYGAKIGAGAYIGEGTTIGANSVVVAGCSVGSATEVGMGVKIGGWVGNGVVIGDSAVTKQGSSIGNRAKIFEHAIIGHGTTIAEGSVVFEGVQIADSLAIPPFSALKNGCFIQATGVLGDSATMLIGPSFSPAHEDPGSSRLFVSITDLPPFLLQSSTPAALAELRSKQFGQSNPEDVEIRLIASAVDFMGNIAIAKVGQAFAAYSAAADMQYRQLAKEALSGLANTSNPQTPVLQAPGDDQDSALSSSL